MKIMFCSKLELFGAIILNTILPKLAGHQIRVFLSDTTRPAENVVPQLIGAKFFDRHLPLKGLFPMIDAQALEGELLTFRGLARKTAVEISTVGDINDSQQEQTIRAWAPDLIVSARFSLIFKRNILQIPRLGSFNIHPGVLPGYAGLGAPMHALLAGESQLGCTLHQIDERIDTGPVYSISYVPAAPQRSIFEISQELYALGLASFETLLAELEAGKTPRVQAQDARLYRYYSLPLAPAFAQFAQLGLSGISYPAYCATLRRFWPPGLDAPSSGLLDPAILEQLARQGLERADDPAALNASLLSFLDHGRP